MTDQPLVGELLRTMTRAIQTLEANYSIISAEDLARAILPIITREIEAAFQAGHRAALGAVRRAIYPQHHYACDIWPGGIGHCTCAYGAELAEISPAIDRINALATQPVDVAAILADQTRDGT